MIRRTFPSPLNELVEFFEATDGAQIPKWRLKAPKYKGTTQSAFAVRLSKARLLREFLRKQASFVCMYEDDVVLDDGFVETLRISLTEAPLGWDCIFLGGAHAQNPVGQGFLLQCRNTFNNHCVVFSRSGAAKVLSRLIKRPCRFAWSDREIANAIKDGGLNAYCLSKFAAHQRKTNSDNWGSSPNAVTLYDDSFSPWMSPDDAHVLFAAAKPGDTVVEWGSGGSTLLFAQRVGEAGKVVSVEYQKRWYDKVNLQLKKCRLNGRSSVIYEPPRPERQQDSAFQLMPKQMDRYVRSPISDGLVEGESVDVVFVDGRQRVRCALMAAKLLKTGGILMIHDFWCRAKYRSRLSELLSEFKYLFETPEKSGNDKQGLAVFSRR